MTTENPQAFSREALSIFLGPYFYLFFRGEHYDMYYFFSVKQNIKDIFIDGHRRKEQ